MTISNLSNCSFCGGTLKLYDKVSRIVRKKGGIKDWIEIRRLRCVDCRKIQRELPDYIFPYKHYHGSIINGVLNGDITPDDIDYEDYPCEMTMRRWTLKKHTPL